LTIGILCLACLIIFTPQQLPNSFPAANCTAPPFTFFNKPGSFTIVITQCLFSTDPYEQVRDWYHSNPTSIMSFIRDFPAWGIGPIHISVSATLDLPPRPQTEQIFYQVKINF
jgi:hypothetical protein